MIELVLSSHRHHVSRAHSLCVYFLHLCVNVVCIFRIYTVLYSRITLDFDYDITCLPINCSHCEQVLMCLSTSYAELYLCLFIFLLSIFVS